MNFLSYEQKTKGKLPSIAIAIAVAVHVIILSIALQASHHIISPPKVFDTFFPEPPKREEVPPQESKPQPKLHIEDIFVPLPPIPDTPRITKELEIKSTTSQPSDAYAAPYANDYVGGGSTTQPRTPIRIAANVDAKACEKPTYPISSIHLTEEGTVNLAMLIGTDGRVLESRVEKSSGSRALDRAAIEGLSLCKFRPATVDGIAEKSWAKLQYVWNIN